MKKKLIKIIIPILVLPTLVAESPKKTIIAPCKTNEEIVLELTKKKQDQEKSSLKTSHELTDEKLEKLGVKPKKTLGITGCSAK